MSEEIPEPGSAEWNEEVLREAKRIQFYEESKNLAKQMQRGNHSSSWERIDLNDAIDRSEDSLEPKWMIRADGAALLYPGCTHSFHGATGSGKTWAALLACAQVLNDTEEHVLYVDYESFAVQIIRRLKMLGVSPLVLKSRLHYIRPQHRPDVADVDRNAFSGMLSENYAIAVIDGANISMGLAGLNPNNAEEVAEWHNLILNPIAETTGAAVIANDHVPKRDELMGFAIGSQHKIAGLTGAAYRVEKLKSFGRGKYGIAAICVGDKDREGYIHEIGVEHGQLEGLFVTELHIDATGINDDGGVVGGLHVPDGANIQRLADKRGKKPATGGDSSRPTKEMEVVSAYWEEKKNDDPMACLRTIA